MCVGDLPKACADARVLIAAGAADAVPGELHECARRLSSWLVMQQGVPTAVGSGRGSARRKLHAVVHSQRLESAGWPSAAKLLNSTVTWTGDLGAESRFWQMRATAPELFGNW
eukprot:2159928-Lingulodinium_polyedra.AAC.1